jgi:predicted CoA-binding protein
MDGSTMGFQEELIREFTNLRVWAVVGASSDPSKYGHKVLMRLQEAGYQMYPVNPRGGEIEGMRVYPTLADLPVKPDVVNVVVPPAITEGIVKECARLGLTRVWMQPGAESDAAIRFCHDHGIRVVHHACAMVHRRFWAGEE